jgi:hypothetical protein
MCAHPAFWYPVVLVLVPACRSSQPSQPALPAELSAQVEQLYEAFDFDAGGGADWNSLEKLFLEEACIVNPFADGALAQVSSRSEFLREFQAYVRSDSVCSTGLHERILAVRGEFRGNIAHTWVEFEGFLPATGELKTRGVDSIQWVLDSTRWRVAAFTTHYRR